MCLEQSAGNNYELCQSLSPACIPAAPTQTSLSTAVSLHVIHELILTVSDWQHSNSGQNQHCVISMLVPTPHLQNVTPLVLITETYHCIFSQCYIILKLMYHSHPKFCLYQISFLILKLRRHYAAKRYVSLMRAL